MYRKLDIEDLLRMNIPKKYWKVSFDKICDKKFNDRDDSPKSMVGKYIKNIEKMRGIGCGFIFWGPNGSGKTGTSVVIAKEFRRRGYPVLYMEAAAMKKIWISKEMFDEDETWRDRATSVDVLILDDFGKGVMDGTGFGATIFDELIRTRNANNLVTIITSNASPNNRNWVTDFEIKESTQQTLSECFLSVLIDDKNRRTEKNKDLYAALNS